GSSATNIFAPASYVDYHEIGGEPTTVVDRYPFTPGKFGNTTSSNQYRDLVYVSNPLGLAFPGFSEFYKSSDGGQTFRVPPHNPYFFNEPTGTEASGGGDSHQAVGQTTHSVFFIDLSGACVTMNISRDLGPTACPDPQDPNFWIAGPVVVDTTPTSPHWHSLYIPFERFDGNDFSLWVAISRDQGNTWTRQLVRTLGANDPANIFPQLTIDTGGNLYYTWAQTQNPDDEANLGGE